MGCSAFLWSRTGVGALGLTILISVMPGCADLDRLTKPRVDGLQRAQYFNSSTLREGGIGDTRVLSSLAPGDVINLATLKPMLDASIRNKRPDLAVNSSGRFQVTANIIANDVSNREDDLDTQIYKWSGRRVKVSYTVIDASTKERVWSGIIESSGETLATYEKKKAEKSRDKVLDAVIAVISKREPRPYPSPPIFSDIVQRNFDGFALNLPFDK
ncbi:MAG: hypothetical protein GY792_11075 [Gammaproteobacteria bacterium]|nr:hypothetical protein [Gammaproteobacteria bacterium]